MEQLLKKICFIGSPIKKLCSRLPRSHPYSRKSVALSGGCVMASRKAKWYTCSACPEWQECASFAGMRRHNFKHDPQQQFVCTFCQKKLSEVLTTNAISVPTCQKVILHSSAHVLKLTKRTRHCSNTSDCARYSISERLQIANVFNF